MVQEAIIFCVEWWVMVLPNSETSHVAVGYNNVKGRKKIQPKIWNDVPHCMLHQSKENDTFLGPDVSRNFPLQIYI